jgi:leucyl-tRNA synthetase
VPCPTCGAQARRETDVSDTFLDSSWYFLRYPSTQLQNVAFDAQLTQKWLPVNSYIGGNEHAVLHMLYSRFITMVLHDAGLVPFDEPFKRFRAHGTIVRDGSKMSKSRGNVVIPDQYIDQWGADSFRTYLMFLGPFEEGGDFQDRSIAGVRRFLDRVWSSVVEAKREGKPDADVLRKLHKTIRKVSEDIPKLNYNTAIAAMMEYLNVVRTGDRQALVSEVEPLVQMLAPFAPHIAEELWQRLGHPKTVFDSNWPAFDAKLAADDVVTVAVQVNGKTRGTIQVAPDVLQEQALAMAMKDESIAKFVTGTPARVIYVRGRLLNIVVS